MTDINTIAEANARISARGAYSRWLAYRFANYVIFMPWPGEMTSNRRTIASHFNTAIG